MLLGGAAAVIALVVVLLVGGRDGGPSHPDAWDPRVEPLVQFVEDERSLSFMHPVHVDFLTPREYTEEVTTDSEDLSDEDRESLERAGGLMRALGLIEGDVDLLDAVNTLEDEGTLAFYDHENDRVRVRGTELTPALELTLVHELTHALQDQHFDLSRLGEFDTDAESVTLRALIEGDAERVESAYEQTLSDAERQELDAESQSDKEAAALDTLPPSLVTFFASPYVLGRGLVEVIVAEEGRDGLDEVLRSPPDSEEPLLNPFSYFERQERLEVGAPELQAGDDEQDRGEFGTIAWYVVLTQRIDPHVALEAADGWAGDEYVQFERDGRSCVAATFLGEAAADNDEMAEALTTWVAAGPAGSARIDRLGGAVELHACDPGADVDLPDALGPEEVLFLPAIRAGIGLDFLREGAPIETADCASDEILATFTVEELQNIASLIEQDPNVQRRIVDAVGSCRRAA